MSQPPSLASPDREHQFIERFGLVKAKLLHELHKVIIGQDEVIELLLAAMFCAGALPIWWACRGWLKRC